MGDESGVSNEIRVIAELQGLDKALMLFSGQVAAAAEIALKLLGASSQDLATDGWPVAVFDPARYDRADHWWCGAGIICYSGR